MMILISYQMFWADEDPVHNTTSSHLLVVFTVQSFCYNAQTNDDQH